MVMEVRRLGSPLAALGAAAQFVGQRRPFADFRAAVLIDTLRGQVMRGHYLVALEGQRLQGYIGWAMLETAVAERIARHGGAPTEAEAAAGTAVVWVQTVAATQRASLLACVNRLRTLHPGLRVMGVRHGRHGKVVIFDSVILPRRDEILAPTEPLRP